MSKFLTYLELNRKAYPAFEDREKSRGFEILLVRLEDMTTQQPQTKVQTGEMTAHGKDRETCGDGAVVGTQLSSSPLFK